MAVLPVLERGQSLLEAPVLLKRRSTKRTTRRPEFVEPDVAVGTELDSDHKEEKTSFGELDTQRTPCGLAVS